MDLGHYRCTNGNHRFAKIKKLGKMSMDVYKIDVEFHIQFLIHCCPVKKI